MVFAVLMDYSKKHRAPSLLILRTEDISTPFATDNTSLVNSLTVHRTTTNAGSAQMTIEECAETPKTEGCISIPESSRSHVYCDGYDSKQQVAKTMTTAADCAQTPSAMTVICPTVYSIDSGYETILSASANTTSHNYDTLKKKSAARQVFCLEDLVIRDNDTRTEILDYSVCGSPTKKATTNRVRVIDSEKTTVHERYYGD